MNPFKPFAMAALCLLAVPLPAVAGAGTAGVADASGAPAVPTAVEPAFTLGELIGEALRNNRNLQAVRYTVDAGRARLTQAGTRPPPRLELGAGSDFLFGNDGEYAASVGISQEFPITDRISRQQAVARTDIAMAETDVSSAARQLAGDVAADVYRLQVIDRRLQSRRELIAQTDTLARATQARYKAAEVSELDINAVRLDLRRQQQARQLLESQRRSVLADLNTRVGRPADAPLTIDEPLPETDPLPEVDRLQQLALASRPDLRTAQLGGDRARSAKALAQAGRWEDWSAGVAMTQDRLVIDGAPPQSASRAIQFNLSIPLPLYQRNQGQIAEAEAALAQANAQADALRAAIANEIGNAWHEASTLQTQLREYREELFPVSARSVRLAQKGYADGLAAMPEVLQAQRQHGELNDAYLNTLDQFLQALVRLHTAAGDYLPATVNAEHKDS